MHFFMCQSDIFVTACIACVVLRSHLFRMLTKSSCVFANSIFVPTKSMINGGYRCFAGRELDFEAINGKTSPLTWVFQRSLSIHLLQNLLFWSTVIVGRQLFYHRLQNTVLVMFPWLRLQTKHLKIFSCFRWRIRLGRSFYITFVAIGRHCERTNLLSRGHGYPDAKSPQPIFEFCVVSPNCSQFSLRSRFAVDI